MTHWLCHRETATRKCHVLKQLHQVSEEEQSPACLVESSASLASLDFAKIIHYTFGSSCLIGENNFFLLLNVLPFLKLLFT